MRKKLLIWIIVIGLIIWLVPYSLPLIFALLTALLLEPAISSLQKSWKLKRLGSVMIVFSLFLLLFGLVIYYTVSTLVNQIIHFSMNVPSLLEDLVQIANKWIEQWKNYSSNIPKEVIVSLESNMESFSNTFITAVKAWTQNLLLFMAALPELFIHIIIYFIALFLFSLELPKLKEQASQYLSEQTKEKLSLVYFQLSRAGIGFLKAQFFLSLLTFTLAVAGLFLLDVEYPVLLSVLIVIVDILPILGTGSVLVPWAIYCFAIGSQGTGIGLIVLFIVITVVRRIVEPKVFSTSLGISPLAALISMYLGFQLIGVLGLLAGPALVIIFQAFVHSGIVKVNFKI
jgi:sporulation integral membrane protein YtvI